MWTGDTKKINLRASLILVQEEWVFSTKPECFGIKLQIHQCFQFDLIQFLFLFGNTF